MLHSIISAFQVALTTVFNFVPHLVGFIVIALVGWLVAWLFDKADRYTAKSRLWSAFGPRWLDQN